jgi:hypothetical protein
VISVAQRLLERAGDLLAGPGADRAAQCGPPALGRHRRQVQPQVGEDRYRVHVVGDVLGATLGGDVLGAGQRRAAAPAREAEQVLDHLGDGAARAFLPRRVGGRVYDDLTDDPPARVVGLAAGDEEVRERLGDDDRVALRPVLIEVAQCRGDVATLSDGSGKLLCSPPGLAS